MILPVEIPVDVLRRIMRKNNPDKSDQSGCERSKRKSDSREIGSRCFRPILPDKCDRYED